VEEPYDADLWPAVWRNNLNPFQRLIIIRILRPEKLINGIENMIIQLFGS